MSDIQVFDKVIPQAYADAIEMDLTRSQFPWNYISDVTGNGYGSNSGFAHVAYELGKQPTEWYPFIKPLLYSIAEAAGHEIEELLRIRVGFLHPVTENTAYNSPHLDFTMPHYTACYYACDSDGDTVLFDQTAKDTNISNFTEANLKAYTENAQFTIAQRVSPKKGRVCIFDGMRFHSSSTPVTHNRRLVITVNYVAHAS